MRIRSVLRWVALALASAALAQWAATGANRGWTKTSVPIVRKEAVTDLEYQEYVRRFVPGIDFLAAAGLGAGILITLSFVFRSPSTPNRT